MLDHHRQCRCGDVGAIGGDDEVDLVDIEQLRIDAGHQGRVGLVVVIDELDRAAEQPAFGIRILGPDLHCEQSRGAVDREPAGQWHAEANRDRRPRRRLG